MSLGAGPWGFLAWPHFLASAPWLCVIGPAVSRGCYHAFPAAMGCISSTHSQNKLFLPYLSCVIPIPLPWYLVTAMRRVTNRHATGKGAASQTLCVIIYLQPWIIHGWFVSSEYLLASPTPDNSEDNPIYYIILSVILRCVSLTDKDCPLNKHLFLLKVSL